MLTEQLPGPVAARPPRSAPPAGAGTAEALRFAVTGPRDLCATRGIVLADLLHRLVVRELDGGRGEIIGHAGAANGRTHAHWAPLPEAGVVRTLLVWVPAGLSTAEVAAMLMAASRAGAAKQSRWRRVPGASDLVHLRLDLRSAGQVAMVAPELCGPVRVWRSLTRYLPVRHRKREALADYLTEDIRHESAYRSRRPAIVHRLGPADTETDPWASTFRRHRLKESRRRDRPGWSLRLVFDTPEPGPLLLGQLSHLGFGIFIPESRDR